MGPVRLEGERVVLRELSGYDYPAVRAYVEDPEVTRYLAIPTAEEDTRAWLRAVAEGREADPRTSYGLAIEVDGALAGTIGIDLGRHGTAGMGWALRRAAWGRGYAAEAAALLAGFAIDTLGVRRITATCDVRNVRSQRVMEKVFMRREAHMALDEPSVDGGMRSSYLYALLADELRALRAFPAEARAACGLELRIERPSDLKVVHDLQREVGRGMLDEHGVDHWAEPYPLDQMQADARRRETYLLSDAAGPAASFTVGLTPMWLSEDTIGWPPAVQPLWLHRLMVRPDLQSSGLGSQIMRLVETLGSARGCDAVRLETRADFEAVQRFYARNGYVEVERHESEDHHPWNALEKRLG